VIIFTVLRAKRVLPVIIFTVLRAKRVLPVIKNHVNILLSDCKSTKYTKNIKERIKIRLKNRVFGGVCYLQRFFIAVTALILRLRVDQI
jgi:hypothetical protein